MGKALEGIRVLDFTTMAAGPTAAAMLAAAVGPAAIVS